MDEGQFWSIIADTRTGFDESRADGNQERQAGRLREILSAMPPEEVAAFSRQFTERMRAAYRWGLWAAAYIIEGGCSDDSFSDFRAWLISMGRDVYEAAMRDPESLVEVADGPGVEIIVFEEFQYIPQDVYEKQTGTDLPAHAEPHPKEPAGEPWQEDGDELEARFPLLWAKYGDA